MRSLILIAILTLGLAASADARNCNTNCGPRHNDGSQNCQTWCSD